MSAVRSSAVKVNRQGSKVKAGARTRPSFSIVAPATSTDRGGRLASASGEPTSGAQASGGGGTPSSAPKGTVGPHKLPPNFGGIEPGCLVLAGTGNIDDGWWEAVVSKLKGDGFELIWRDYPAEPPFTRKREELALLHPAYKIA